MSTISDIGTTMIIGGILQPAFTDRFKVTFRCSGCNREEMLLLTMQLVSFIADYSKRTISVVIEQASSHSKIHNLINDFYQDDMFRKDISITMFSINRDNGVNHALEYSLCKMETHKFELNYGISDFAKHVMVFSFNDVREIRPEDYKKQ